MIFALCLLTLAICCYSISQLAIHGKIKHRNFWDSDSWERKYASDDEGHLLLHKNNWYYKYFKITYKEKFPLSATFLVFLTDGYHLMQFMFFNFLAFSLTFAIGFNWILLVAVWTLIHGVHFITYKFLSK